jgi:hypothetical protein
MTSQSGIEPENPIEANQALAKLLAAGHPGAVFFRGYVGPSQDDKVINLYPSLLDLRRSVEIAREDVVLIQSAAEAGLADGSMIVWVVEQARVTHRRVAIAGDFSKTQAPAIPAGAGEVQKGRLRIQVHNQAASCRVCYSLCSPPPCHSPPVCQSRGCA